MSGLANTRSVALLVLSALILVSVFLGAEYGQRYGWDYWQTRARRFDAAGAFARAADAYFRAWSLDTARLDVLECSARDYMRSHRSEDAVKILRLELRQRPDEILLWQQKGNELWKLLQFGLPANVDKPGELERWRSSPQVRQKWDEMNDAYQQAIRRAPSGTLFRDLINRASAMGRRQDVITLYKEVQRLIPDSAWVWSDYAAYVEFCGGDVLDRAVAAVDRAIELDPARHGLWTTRARLLAKEGQLAPAVAAWDTAIAHGVSGPPYLSWTFSRKGFLLHESGRLQEAESAYVAAVRADRTNDLAWLGIAQVRRLQDKPPQEQLAALDSSLAVGEHSSSADWHRDKLLLRGVVLTDLGRDDEALADLDSVVAACGRRSCGATPSQNAMPKGCKPDLIGAWLGKAAVYERRRDFARAVACTDSVLGVDEHVTEAWSAKARLLDLVGRSAEATVARVQAGTLETAEKRQRAARTTRREQVATNSGAPPRPIAVAVRKPERSHPATGPMPSVQEWRERAKECAFTGRWVEADEAYSRVVLRTPNDPQAWWDRAAARAQSGRTSEAISDLRHSLALKPAPRAWAAIDAEFEKLWGDPDFETLVKTK